MELIEGNNYNNTLIASDSWAARTSIKTKIETKSFRQGLIFEIHNLFYRMHKRGLMVYCIWVPAHVGLEGNEDINILAKQSLKSHIVETENPLSRAEGKSMIKKCGKSMVRILGLTGRYRKTPLYCTETGWAWK